MNAQQENKITTQLAEIKQDLNNNKLSLQEMSNLFHIRNELEFKLNKKNINFTLKGKNKYYYATHCNQFTKYLEQFGYGRISKEEIKEKGISFNDYSINLGYSKYNQDLKRFESKQELLGFVIGYNNAISNIKNN